MYLDGGFVHHLLWGGAAPQKLDELGGEARALFNPARTILKSALADLDAIEENGEHPLRGILDDQDAAVKIPLPLGVRQLLQYRLELRHLAEALGRENFDAVLRAQKFIIGLNEQTAGDVIGEFRRANFFGFDPKNILFVISPNYPAFEYKDGQWQEVFDSSVLTGHGYPLMQTVIQKTAFYVDEKGYTHEVAEAPLEYFKGIGRQGKLVMNNWNIGDLVRLGGEADGRSLHAIDSRRAAMALKLMEQGADIVAETVENVEGKEGGGWFKPAVLIESVQTRTARHEDIDWSEVPHNRFATWSDVNALLDSLQLEGLPQYLVPTMYQGRPVMTVQSFAGDATRMGRIHAAAFQEEGVKLLPFNRVSHTRTAMRQMAKQDNNREFQGLVEEIYGSTTNIAFVQPTAPTAAMGGNMALLLSQLEEFHSEHNTDASGHIAELISTVQKAPVYGNRTPADVWEREFRRILQITVLRAAEEQKNLPAVSLGVAQGLLKSSPEARGAFYRAMEWLERGMPQYGRHPVVIMVKEMRQNPTRVVDNIQDWLATKMPPQGPSAEEADIARDAQTAVQRAL